MQIYYFSKRTISIIFLLAFLSCTQNKQNAEVLNQELENNSIYANKSGITTISLLPRRIIQLKKIAIVWGLLKYFHPSMTSGKVDSDVSLFKIIPKIISLPETKTDSLLMEWITQLENEKIVSKRINKIPYSEIMPPTWDSSISNLFSPILLNNLKDIYSNFSPLDSSRYVSFNSPIGNPIFTNESEYLDQNSPDAGIRLLALFRYWNIIQYYYPYRYLVTEWNSILDKYIPIFNNATTPALYTIACIELVAEIKDTHANVFGTKVIDSLKGFYICPFQVKYIENNLVVCQTYSDPTDLNNLKQGDVIQSIDLITPEHFIKKYSNRISASNRSTMLKILFSNTGFALRSNKRLAFIIFFRNKKKYILKIKRIPVTEVSSRNDWREPVSNAFSNINQSIGYIYPELLKKEDYRKIVEEFSSKKGLIIDLRCYPSLYLPSFLCTWLQCDTTPFAKIKKISTIKPGTLDDGKAIRISNTEIPPSKYFFGKLVILVNSSTISQGEFTTMALSHRANTIIIGSETAGADGDISSIVFPGGIKTFISGTAIFYPNGRETQRVGIIPQLRIEQTLESIQKKYDSQFTAGFEWLNK